jgi:hypothetical protein
MLQDYLHCGFIYVHCDDDGYVVATQIGTSRDLDDYGPNKYLAGQNQFIFHQF